MRTSNIILLTLLLLSFGTITLAVTTIRYKVDHHLYDEKKEVVKDQFATTPLSPFSQLVLDGYEDVEIHQGKTTSIGWIKDKQGSSVPYRVSGDSLVLRDLGGSPHLDRITITVQNLSAIYLRNAGGFKMLGTQMDSLAIYSSESGGDMGFDAVFLKRLHLVFGGSNTFTIRNSIMGGVWLDLKDDATLSLEQSDVHWIKGHLEGNIKADSATLHHGIEKIETIQ